MPEDFKTALKNIKNEIPSGWDYTIEGDKLKFQTIHDIYVLMENKINAPVFFYGDSEENADRIRKNGQKTKGSITFRIMPYKNADELLKYKGKICFYYDNTIFVLEEGTGIMDEFHSVFPFNTDDDIFKIKDILRKYLIPVLIDSSNGFSAYVDKKVMITGTFSDMPWQHMIKDEKTYRYSEYFDTDKTQIVAYFKTMPKKIKKTVSLSGTIIKVSGNSKKPGEDAEYFEYAILADEIK